MYSMMSRVNNIIYLKTGKRINLQCSHKKIVSMYRVTSSQMTNAYMARNTEESEIMALNMHAYSTPTFIPAG